VAPVAESLVFGIICTLIMHVAALAYIFSV
jgi:hypothetical protein